MFQKLRYKLQYWRRRFYEALGWCHRCGNALNFTRHGRGLCPWCSR
jgi:hypothetical protein